MRKGGKGKEGSKGGKKECSYQNYRMRIEDMMKILATFWVSVFVSGQRNRNRGKRRKVVGKEAAIQKQDSILPSSNGRGGNWGFGERKAKACALCTEGRRGGKSNEQRKVFPFSVRRQRKSFAETK